MAALSGKLASALSAASLAGPPPESCCNGPWGAAWHGAGDPLDCRDWVPRDHPRRVVAPMAVVLRLAVAAGGRAPAAVRMRRPG